MQAHHFDRVTGVFIGSEPAFESPLEQGVFVAPAWSTLKPPPTPPKGMQAVFAGDIWTVQPIPEPEPVEEPPAPVGEGPLGPPPVLTPEEREEMLRASLANHLAAAQSIVVELEARRAALEA